MKKFLYFFGILALIAGFVSSCSKDDENDNENEQSIPQKRIAKVIEFPGDLDESIYVYEYDDKGRCISYAFTDTYSGRITKHSYTYEGNTMTEEWTYNGEPFSCIYTFDSKGNLTSKKYEDLDGSDYYTYKYDNKGHLISETRTNGYSTRALSFEWEDGNVSKITEYYKSEKQESTQPIIFKYTNSEHPTPIKNAAKLSVFQSNYFDLDPISSNFGIAPKNLPVHVIETILHGYDDEDGNSYYTTDTEEYDLDWLLDGDQHPIKMIFKDEDSEYTYFDISWE